MHTRFKTNPPLELGEKGKLFFLKYFRGLDKPYTFYLICWKESFVVGVHDIIYLRVDVLTSPLLSSLLKPYLNQWWKNYLINMKKWKINYEISVRLMKIINFLAAIQDRLLKFLVNILFTNELFSTKSIWVEGNLFYSRSICVFSYTGNVIRFILFFSSPFFKSMFASKFLVISLTSLLLNTFVLVLNKHLLGQNNYLFFSGLRWPKNIFGRISCHFQYLVGCMTGNLIYLIE